jgi:hypothetical protein
MAQETEHLAEAERHIAEYKQRIADQERRIVRLAADGHPIDDSLKLLTQFKETLRLAEDHRDRILRELKGEFELPGRN